MGHWLIIHDRSTGRLLTCDEYQDGGLAIRHRFEWERFYAGCDDAEVVVLSAASLDAVRATHGRYFALVARELPDLVWP
jgi:hypothetical protein